MREANLTLLRLAALAIIVVAMLAAANLGGSGDRGALLPQNARPAATIMADAISSAHGQACVYGGESASDLATYGALDDSAIPMPCPAAAMESPRQPLPGDLANMLARARRSGLLT
jgi:hypothetical protein